MRSETQIDLVPAAGKPDQPGGSGATLPAIGSALAANTSCLPDLPFMMAARLCAALVFVSILFSQVVASVAADLPVR